MSAPYFFFRPILAADRSWAALDCRSGGSVKAESTDFVRCFAESAAAPLAHLMPMVVSADPAWLERNAFVANFDPDQVVFVLPAASLDSTHAIERCIQLRAQGYHFCLDINGVDLVRRVPHAAFDYLQFEAAFARQELPPSDLIHARDTGFRKIAAKVGSYEMFDWVSDKEFEWCDGHFLAARNPHYGKVPDLSRLKLLRLLNIVKHDGDTHDIEAIFREEPKLSYNLLRLVNSVAIGARTRISNFSQAITLLGRRQLQRWLQLLIYANNLADGHAPNPLMLLAAARGRQLELLSAAIEPKSSHPDLCDNAFMTGLFSLLEVLINLPMDEILKELPLHDEVVEALKPPVRGGILGQLLAAVIAGEAGEFSNAETILSGFGISPAAHAKSQVEALYWASQINVENSD